MSYSDYNSSGATNISIPKDKVYADLDLGLTKHPVYNDIRALTDIDAVKNSVRNLLLTNKGERPFRPNVGSNLTQLLFEHANPFTYETIRQNISDMLQTYEPRINQVRVRIDELAPNENDIKVTVGFNITSVAAAQEVEFYLERLR
jgi:phage baseplate assembly protein W